MTFRQTLKEFGRQMAAVERRLQEEGMALLPEAFNLTEVEEALERGCYGAEGIRVIDALTQELPAQATLTFDTLADAAKVFANTASRGEAFHPYALLEILRTEDPQNLEELKMLVGKAYEKALERHHQLTEEYERAGGYCPLPMEIHVSEETVGWYVSPYEGRGGKCPPLSEVILEKRGKKFQVTYKGTCEAVRSRLEKARRPIPVLTW